MAKYGIPYMGSKGSIAESIIQMMPKADNFYDLFGGGFAITHAMVVNKPNKYKALHYNEIKADIVELVKRAIAGEFNYDVFKPKWISREDFFANLDDPYIRVCWSFGNNYKKGYLFGPDIEPYKKSMHQAVIFGEFDDLATQVLGFKKWPLDVKNIKQRRIYLSQKINFYRIKNTIPDCLIKFLNEKQKKEWAIIKGNIQLQKLQQLEQLERLQELKRLERLQELKRLEQLQELKQLEQLQQLERLERKIYFSSKSYDQVEILPNAVVYCDPPYSGTTDYGNNFDTKNFLDWAASRKFPVYISEYELKDARFKLVYTVDKRSILSACNTSGNKAERLYWNGVRL